MATHSSILAWKIPWTEAPGGLQSMGLQRVGHNWATEHTHGGKSMTKNILYKGPEKYKGRMFLRLAPHCWFSFSYKEADLIFIDDLSLSGTDGPQFHIFQFSIVNLLNRAI